MFSTKRIFASLVLFAGFGVSTVCSATAFSVGNPVPGGSIVDSCASCAYIIGQDFNKAGSLSTYTFSAGNAGDITPLLLSYILSPGSVTFKVIGIGTTQTIGTAGDYTFAFGLTSGTNNTAASGTAFGFYSNAPVVRYDYFPIGSSPASGGAFFINPGPLTLGETSTDNNTAYSMDTLGEPNNRTYAINATATPEPATLSLLALGLTSLGATRLRRR